MKTQSESYAALLPKMGDMQSKILYFLDQYSELCCYDLQQLMRKPHQTISGQLWHLERKGMVETTGKTKFVPQTNRNQNVYRTSRNFLDPSWKKPLIPSERIEILQETLKEILDNPDYKNNPIAANIIQKIQDNVLS